MRRLSACTALLVLLVVPALAAGPTGSVDASVRVSVQVVRSCAISTTGGHASVNCGTTTGSAQTAFAGAPAPRVSDPLLATSGSSGVVTVDF
jgi:hypothetical protein